MVVLENLPIFEYWRLASMPRMLNLSRSIATHIWVKNHYIILQFTGGFSFNRFCIEFILSVHASSAQLNCTLRILPYSIACNYLTQYSVYRYRYKYIYDIGLPLSVLSVLHPVIHHDSSDMAPVTCHIKGHQEIYNLFTKIYNDLSFLSIVGKLQTSLDVHTFPVTPTKLE